MRVRSRAALTLLMMIPLISSTDMSTFLQSFPSQIRALTFVDAGLVFCSQSKWFCRREKIAGGTESISVLLLNSALSWKAFRLRGGFQMCLWEKYCVLGLAAVQMTLVGRRKLPLILFGLR